MRVLVGFTTVVMLSLLGYMSYRLFLRRKPLMLVSLCLQIFSITIALFAFSGDVQSNNLIEISYICFGVVIPGIYFTYDYGRMMKKIKEQGVYDGLIEVCLNNNDGEEDKELSKKHINPIIKERQVPELVKDLNLNKDDIIRNLKKSLYQAQSFINAKEYENAYEIYNTIVKLIRNCPGLYFNHGNLCFSRGNYLEAVQSYKKVLEIDESKIKEIKAPRDVFAVVKTDKDSAEKPKAEDDIRYEEFTVYYNLGNAYFHLNKHEQAIEAYKKAIDINPGLDDAYENIARSLIASERISEAIEYYGKIADGDANNYRVHVTLGKLFMEVKRYNEAIAEFNKAVVLNSICEEAYDSLGRAYVKKKLYNEAANAYRQYIRTKPDSQKAFYNLGMALYHAGNRNEAVENFKKVVELDSTNYKGYYNMAVALEELGMQGEAVTAFKKAIGIRPDFIDAYNNLGILLSTQGRHLEALDIYIKGLKKNPEECSLYYNMGVTLSEMGRYAEAVEAYRSALEIKPTEHEISYHLAAALVELKKYAEAVETYKGALKVMPTDSELYYGLAAVYSLLRKHDIAMDNLRKAIELNTDLKEDAKRNSVFEAIRFKGEFRELVS